MSKKQYLAIHPTKGVKQTCKLIEVLGNGKYLVEFAGGVRAEVDRIYEPVNN